MVKQPGKIVVVEPEIHRKLKIIAAKEGGTVQDLVDKAIKTMLNARKEGDNGQTQTY